MIRLARTLSMLSLICTITSAASAAPGLAGKSDSIGIPTSIVGKTSRSLSIGTFAPYGEVSTKHAAAETFLSNSPSDNFANYGSSILGSLGGVCTHYDNCIMTSFTANGSSSAELLYAYVRGDFYMNANFVGYDTQTKFDGSTAIVWYYSTSSTSTWAVYGTHAWSFDGITYPTAYSFDHLNLD